LILSSQLQEIRDKYPPWLEKEAPSLSEADMARYKSQLESIQAVCRQYEEDPNNFSRLLELIQKVGYCAREDKGPQHRRQQHTAQPMHSLVGVMHVVSKHVLLSIPEVCSLHFAIADAGAWRSTCGHCRGHQCQHKS
jgi:hypothetical protein